MPMCINVYPIGIANSVESELYMYMHAVNQLHHIRCKTYSSALHLDFACIYNVCTQ